MDLSELLDADVYHEAPLTEGTMEDYIAALDVP